MSSDKVILCLSFDNLRLKETLELLSESQGTDIYLIWNNNDKNCTMDHRRFTSIIQGSNQLWEWSGYQEGIGRLLAEQSNIESALFINDTAYKHSATTKVLDVYLRGLETSASSGSTYILGRYDTASRPMVFELDSEFAGWISTFCFVITRDLFPLIGEVCLYLSNFRVDNRKDGVNLYESFFDELHPTMASHLHWWLFGGGWYKSEPLSNENYLEFRQKLRSILGEFKLTQLCKSRASIVRTE